MGCSSSTSGRTKNSMDGSLKDSELRATDSTSGTGQATESAGATNTPPATATTPEAAIVSSNSHNTSATPARDSVGRRSGGAGAAAAAAFEQVASEERRSNAGANTPAAVPPTPMSLLDTPLMANRQAERRPLYRSSGSARVTPLHAVEVRDFRPSTTPLETPLRSQERGRTRRGPASPLPALHAIEARNSRRSPTPVKPVLQAFEERETWRSPIRPPETLYAIECCETRKLPTPRPVPLRATEFRNTVRPSAQWPSTLSDSAAPIVTVSSESEAAALVSRTESSRTTSLQAVSSMQPSTASGGVSTKGNGNPPSILKKSSSYSPRRDSIVAVETHPGRSDLPEKTPLSAVSGTGVRGAVEDSEGWPVYESHAARMAHSMPFPSALPYREDAMLEPVRPRSKMDPLADSGGLMPLDMRGAELGPNYDRNKRNDEGRLKEQQRAMMASEAADWQMTHSSIEESTGWDVLRHIRFVLQMRNVMAS
ncbi:hypothetical protein DQ04_02331060 [Trypanosoma grayi]|uniref:hypothetical protein n=1 Tax=Trypanosoma grayi TaxID=71804 RepID=UPI0004F4B942|nr:hypothetical protein DQ04_02331060 [Trypanosoma grayi]KEG11735.1 hypothetical protein DQ04_02331060 [Trypanosoma grayi]